MQGHHLYFESVAKTRPNSGFRRTNIGRLLLRTFEHFEDRIVDGLRSQGFEDFRLSDTSVLRSLELEGSRITDLAERARITKQGMSQLVQDLEARGYIHVESDPEDGRAKLIRFTARGEALIAAGQEINRSLDREWQRALGKNGFQTLRVLLERLLAWYDRPFTFEAKRHDGVDPWDRRKPGGRQRQPKVRRRHQEEGAFHV